MWGFDLDMTAVRLMRRDNGKWQEVAAEKIEGADIEERLMALVARVDDGAPVDLFLPRDQILYTDVAIQSEDTARSEIERALEGATPYAVEDLDLDWEMTAAGEARVAAIALETLDEAVAFAEVRGLKIGGFSSLADPSDFPRMPDFTGHNVLTIDDDESEVQAAPVHFASGRVTSKPRPDAGSLAPVAPENEPVVKVEDEAPIMRIKAPSAPPLNPGRPIDAPSSAPRVRTDIAAAVVSEQVASLSPPSVKVRRSSPAFLGVGAVFALALIVTIGIATLIWQLLPMGPSGTDLPLTEDTGAGVETPSPALPEVEVAEPVVEPTPERDAGPEVEVAAPTPEPEPAPEPKVAEAPVVPDLPKPVIIAEPGVLSAPVAGDVPALAEVEPVTKSLRPRFRTALRSGEGLPYVDLGLPDEPTPALIAAVPKTAPTLEPAPEVDPVGAVRLTLTSPDRLTVDVASLPEASAFAIADLPEHGAAPDPFVAPEVLTPENPEAIASVEPTETLRPDETSVPADAEIAQVPAEIEATEAPSQAETAEAPPPAGDDGLPVLTAFAQELPSTAPIRRPSSFALDLERQKFGGRTQAELAELRPPARPSSAQVEALAARAAEAESTALAVASSPAPRSRPDGFDAIVAVAVVQRQAERVTASLDYQTPNTNAAIEAALENDAEPEPDPMPRLAIPSSANVARQATIQDAIRLNRVNLVGVYGTAADRRALVRLPSGRFVKVQVGDRVDGGTVSKITDEELVYKKGRRTVLLSVPES